MDKRSFHTGKSQASRDQYGRYIKKLNYEPTIVETIPLGNSDEGGEELEKPKLTRKRKKDPSLILKNHIVEHWFEYLFAGVIAVLMYLMIDSKIDMARMDSHAQYQKDSIDSLGKDSKEIGIKVNEQNLILREHSLRLSTVEGQLNAKIK